MDTPTADISEAARQSRFEFPLHLWAGLWLKVFVDVSGIGAAILASFKGTLDHDLSPHEFASQSAIAATIIAVSALATGYLASRTIYGSLNGSIRHRGWRIAAKTALTIVIPVACVFGAAAVSAAELTAAVREKPPVVVAVTTQSAHGMTESDLTPEFLQGIEGWLIATYRKKLPNQLELAGLDPKQVNVQIEAQSVYNIVAGKKLGITKMRIGPAGTRNVTIIGIVGTELIRVMCARQTDHDIPIYSGTCGRSLEQEFSIKLF